MNIEYEIKLLYEIGKTTKLILQDKDLLETLTDIVKGDNAHQAVASISLKKKPPPLLLFPTESHLVLHVFWFST